MEVNYLGKEDVIAINNEVVKLSSDPHGVISEANLGHAIDAVKFKYNDADVPQEDKIVLKAAFLLQQLANKAHAFIEGNKRTAETATIAFLNVNGAHFEEPDQSAVAEFMLSVARNEQSLTLTAKWLKERESPILLLASNKNRERQGINVVEMAKQKTKTVTPEFLALVRAIIRQNKQSLTMLAKQ